MKRIRDFLRDRSGATAVTFTLLLVPLLGVTGLAVDYSRASNERVTLQNAADAAVLAGASIYDGKNLPAVKTRVLEMLNANLTNAGNSGATHNVTVTKDVPPRILLTLDRPMATTFMRVLNQNAMDIAVKSEASGALAPVEATFNITKVKGIYYKKISVIVVRENGAEEEVAAIEYTNPSQVDGSGISVPAVGSSSQTFKLGKFKTFYFTMIVKKGGCPIGQKNDNNKTPSKRKCVASTSSSDQLTPIPAGLTFQQEYNLKNSANAFLVRSDNANDAWRLALDGAQTTKPHEAEPVLMNDLMNCDGVTKKHGWEDGGGSNPDFEYTLKTGCALDYSKIRLTQ
ncbi:TadE/TadG family type IV pilus assembly protein [Phyllobacterium sophorae]|nr:TadE/TadG family type IV pilus assembly protein [Phyllobacterium sophorae]